MTLTLGESAFRAAGPLPAKRSAARHASAATNTLPRIDINPPFPFSPEGPPEKSILACPDLRSGTPASARQSDDDVEPPLAGDPLEVLHASVGELDPAAGDQV